MTQQDSGNWLEALLAEAKRSNWCSKPFCTTCVGSRFRLPFWREAIRQAGVSSEAPDSSPFHWTLIEGLSESGRERPIRTVLEGLRRLPDEYCYDHAIRTILFDMTVFMALHGTGLRLEEELDGTPARSCMRRMARHDAYMSAERARHEAYLSREAVEERARVRKARKAEAHALRQAQARARGAARLELLADLGPLTASERLVRLAVDPLLIIDWVSHDLIPAGSDEVGNLDRDVAFKLLSRIGQRKRPWRQLRQAIEKHLATGLSSA
jgi:hypothetical protein